MGKTLDKMIESILDRFDFELCLKSNPSIGMGLSEEAAIELLRKTASELLKEVWRDGKKLPGRFYRTSFFSGLMAIREGERLDLLFCLEHVYVVKCS